MKTYELIIIWLFLLFSVGLDLWVLYIWIRRKRLIKWEKATGWTKLNQANLKKYDKQYNLGAKIILTVGAVIFTVVTIPTYQDVPYLLSSDYKEIRGIVTEDQKEKSKALLTTVFIKNADTGKVERLEIGKNFLKKGDQVYIRYLPHSKQGSLIDSYIDLE